MITASHNPVEDNGVKIVNEKGSVLDRYWEQFSEKFINSKDVEEDLKLIMEKHQIEKNEDGVLIVGYDTRPSSVRLADCVIKGAETLGV